MVPSQGLDFSAVGDIARSLPGVSENTLHGGPSWKMRGKLLACKAIHRSAEPNTLMLRIGLAERTQLLSANPSACYLTEHYVNHQAVLIRLSKIDRKSLETLLQSAWIAAGGMKIRR